MHYHLEIIMPPTKDVEEAVRQVLEEYSESWTDEDGNPSSRAFYDYYVIGGRYSGEKLQAGLDQSKFFN